MRGSVKGATISQRLCWTGGVLRVIHSGLEEAGAVMAEIKMNSMFAQQQIKDFSYAVSFCRHSGIPVKIPDLLMVRHKALLNIRTFLCRLEIKLHVCR